MGSSRTRELAAEVSSHAAEAGRLLAEFAAAQAAGGNGVHRDPNMVLRDLDEELNDIRDAAREAEDEVERNERGL